MKNLTPDQIYWLSLLAIVLGTFGIGYLIGFARAWKRGYDDGWFDHDDELAPAVSRLHFTDLKTPPTWVTDEEDVFIEDCTADEHDRMIARGYQWEATSSKGMSFSRNGGAQ